MEFCDKVAIIKNAVSLPGTKSSFENDLSQIQSLRDSLAHANDFAAARTDAENVCQTVRLVEEWICKLRNLVR